MMLYIVVLICLLLFLYNGFYIRKEAYDVHTPSKYMNISSEIRNLPFENTDTLISSIPYKL